MVIGNTGYTRVQPICAPGVDFAKQRLLRAGIVLFGMRITFQDIGAVGWSGALVDAMMLASTFMLALLVGRRWWGMDARSVLLIGAGSSICGAAAVLATEPVVKARGEDVAVAVATVVVFGTLAIFLYPVLYHLVAQYRLFDLSPTGRLEALRSRPPDYPDLRCAFPHDVCTLAPVFLRQSAATRPSGGSAS